MATLLYSPGVRVVIETAAHGIIDVSADLERGSLTLTENQPSTFSFTLANHRRKYDGIFMPNDTISVQMKRIRWLPVFAGYLDEVPYFSVYPRSVQIRASDTLKRLKYRLWDPGSPASYELLTHASPDATTQVDGGLRDKIIALLTDVAEWPARNIHIGRLPEEWSSKLADLQEKMASDIAVDPSTLGSSGVVNGANQAVGGSMTVTPDGPGTGVVPYGRAKATLFAGDAGGTGKMRLSGENINDPRDPWYVAMRWPYATAASLGASPIEGMTAAQFRNAENWWKNRRLIVVNPKNNQAVVVRAAEYGPALPTGKGIGLSKHALWTVLGAKDGDSLEVRFADQKAQLGPASPTQTAAPTAGDTAYQGWSSTIPGASSTPTATPQVVQGASGTRWTDAENLQSNVIGARTFIKANWDIPHGIGGYAKRNIAGTNTPSDHGKGLALDVMVCPGGQRATGSDLAKGNAIAMWFAANPEVFGVKYIIWMDRINTGRGWRTYGHPAGNSNTLAHRDHVHISFKDTGQTSAGPTGNGWAGGTPADFNNNIMPGSGADPSAGGGGMPLINAFEWNPKPDERSSILSGPRALLNDTPLLGTLGTLCGASMRSFMAAPNGDFIAWFPDYFGVYGTAAKLTLRDIELANDGFTITWNDERLVTHQFTAGATTGYTTGEGPGGLVNSLRMYETAGIASVEFPELMEALFNVNPADPRAKHFLDADAILQRFGARNDYKPMGNISGPQAEFWYACFLLQRSWASQFSSRVELTFMPEAWPGMLVYLETFQFQAYIQQVTHNFNFSDGGGFTTDISVVAPSTTGGGLYALPAAGKTTRVPQPPRRGVGTYL